MKSARYAITATLIFSVRSAASAILLIALMCLAVTPLKAHHSYAMFDGGKVLTVSGTVAKLEWMNPHVFVWLYVPNEASGKYELYAFENGSPHVLSLHGWTKTTLQPGEKVAVEYWPLKDGRRGGHFLRATHADGHVSAGAGGPNSSSSGSFAPPPPAKQDPSPP